MSHVRSRIRDAVRTALETIPGLASMVDANRVDPLKPEDLPAIIIFVTDEAIETATIGFPRVQIRTLTVMVDTVVQVNANYDNALDGIAVSIEAKLGGANPFPALQHVKDILLVSAAKVASGAAETDTASLRMEYQIIVHTRENDPEKLIEGE